MLDFIGKRYAVDTSKVSIVGKGLGGYLALRTAQLHGDRFRCAITINAPMNLLQWIEKARWSSVYQQRIAADLELLAPYLGPREYLKEAPLVRDPESIQIPVLMFASRHGDGTDQSPEYSDVLTVARGIRRRGTPVKIHDLDRDYIRQLPNAQAEVFANIESFLYEHLFSYSVDLGELEFLDDETESPDP